MKNLILARNTFEGGTEFFSEGGIFNKSMDSVILMDKLSVDILMLVNGEFIVKAEFDTEGKAVGHSPIHQEV